MPRKKKKEVVDSGIGEHGLARTDTDLHGPGSGEGEATVEEVPQRLVMTEEEVADAAGFVADCVAEARAEEGAGEKRVVDGGQLTVDSEEEEAPAPEAKEEGGNGLVRVGFPLGEYSESAYVSLHVDVQMSRGQAVVLKRLLAGLDGEKLGNGRFVQSSADVVRWILEQIGSSGQLLVDS